MEYYETLDSLPKWAKPSVEKLIERGLLEGGNSGLHLSADMIRLLVINDRAGAYDK